MDNFFNDVKKFNEIYKLQNNTTPTDLGNERISNFLSIISEEVDEGYDIMTMSDSQERLVAMSDWLGDLGVYVASEAQRWGLPLSQILEIIMQSNFSKLDINGKPIYDERGKVMKGPGYWKPEPKIAELLKEKAK
jgi:predicted HAD superfamily Cof-like phosphohydrolase